MKKIIACILAVIMLPTLIAAQQNYLEVAAPGNRQVQMAIAPPLAISATKNDAAAKDIVDALRFDMTLAGPFAVTAAAANESRSGIRSGEFDFAPWKANGIELLIKSGYTITNGTVTLECRLFDVSREKELLAKRYSGSVKDVRRMAHTFADEVMLVITGERGPFAGKIAFVSTQTGNKEIYLMDYDGFNVQMLTRNGSINLNPDFSPSGREIIFTTYKKGNPDLYRKELFTGTEARVSSQRGINITGAFAPDGNRIALAMSKDGNSEIYVINKDGKQIARLTKSTAINVAPAWSPDGSRLAFVSDRLGKPQVFIMNADGSGVRRLTTSGAYNVSPRWSPKGDRIAYCRQEGGGFQIYSITPDGGGDTRLTTEGNNEHPRWSSDGRYITFSSRRGGKESIYVMRADGSGQTLVSRGKGNDSHPTWSPRW